jgi:hypothetical protein
MQVGWLGTDVVGEFAAIIACFACRLPMWNLYVCCQSRSRVGHLPGCRRRLPQQVAPTKWKGLKLLPAAAPSASGDLFRQMCRGLIGMLDPQLAAALPPLLPRRGGSRRGSAGAGPALEPSSPLRRAVHDDLFVGLINSDSEDDEDWQADLEREKKLQVGAGVRRWVVEQPGRRDHHA